MTMAGHFTLWRWAGILMVAILMAGTALLPAPQAAVAADLVVGGGAIVAADELNLRAGPGSHNPRVATLSSGTSLLLLAGPVNGVWWRVLDGTNIGYVDGTWLTPADPPTGWDAYDIDLPVPFHRQNTAYWCDPADLQSWVEYVQGQSLGAEVPVQQRFWDWEAAHNAGYTLQQWNASPYAVASAADQWMPGRGYNHFMYDDPMAATTTVAWLLANPAYREPAVALIWEAEHYVLVRGVRATADPFLDPQARILGVYVMDPNQGGRSWLGEDRYIPISEWLGRHLTAVTYLTPSSGVPGDPWQGKYVMIHRDWTSEGPTQAGRVNASPASYGAGAR